MSPTRSQLLSLHIDINMEDSDEVDTVEARADTGAPPDLGLADSVEGDTAEADTVTVTDADTGAFAGCAGGPTVLVLEVLQTCSQVRGDIKGDKGK